VNLHAFDILVFSAYFIVLGIIGYIASRRRANTKREYFLAGDKLPWWMIGGSIVASNISSHHFIGVMGLAYTIGFAAMTVEWQAVLVGYNALLWIFLPYYLRNGFYTMPEFLELRFSRLARSTFGGLIVLTYLFVEISAVLMLGAIAVEALFPHIDLFWSITGLALVTGLYTIVGGLRAVVWTEMLQLVVLLLGGIALSAATVHAIGGVSQVWATSHEWKLFLPADHPIFPWTMFLGGSLSISIFYAAANQFIVQRVLAAKDEWHARMGVVFTQFLKMLMPLIILVPGLLAQRLYPNLEKGDLAFPTLVRDLLPAGLVGLVLAGLIAAIMSHVSGALNSCTTIATMDFYLPFIRKDATEEQAVCFGRYTGVVFLIIGVAWAQVFLKQRDQPIFAYLLDAYGHFAPGITTMFLFGVLWKRTTNAGALTAGFMTIPLSLLLDFAFPGMAGLNRATIVFWSCVVACFVVSLLTKPRPEEEIKNLIWTRDSLRMPPSLREKMKGLRNPFFWWCIVTGIVGYFYIRYGVMRFGK